MSWWLKETKSAWNHNKIIWAENGITNYELFKNMKRRKNRLYGKNVNENITDSLFLLTQGKLLKLGSKYGYR